MSANNPNDPNNTSAGVSGDPSQWGTRGSGSTGTTDTGTSTGLTTGGGVGAGGGQGGAATGTAAALAQKAKEYGQNVADAATTAKEYVVERAGVVGDKIQDLRNKDYQQVAQEAKEYARQNPGQALLISAAAGFVLGLLLRGSRR